MQKIRYNLLANAQKYGHQLKSSIGQTLHKIAYDEIIEMKSEVLRSFNSICIHGNYP